MLTPVFALGALTLAAAMVLEDEPALFPFVLPWDDASPGVTDQAERLDRPAGRSGPVHAGPDGHLYAGDRRVRFFGVNLCFAANFPRPDDADRLAGRMAKFGINVVRFHHMDMFAYPSGIRARGAAETGQLDPEALDRLDVLTAALARHGVYTNLNLLVSRPFNKADGLPAEIESVDWKDRHVAGFFYEPIRKLQEDYARRFLTHRNPHTGRTYAEDPAVAFVEINNENGLVQGWLGRQVDRLPEVFRKDLERQWNRWLAKRHGQARMRPIVLRAGFEKLPAEAQREWLRFLWETEDAYWQHMRHFLKEELKVRGVVVGTIVGCSTPNLMAAFDAVDTHAYWQHPKFPGRPWDPDNWVVPDRAMVNDKAGGTLPGLALRRVAGKPHCVTEYNHAAPNEYGAEGFLLLAAYGALQDWDAIYAFAYSHSGRWDKRHFDSFFDIDQHPTKMATLPAAVALFVRGDVRPAKEQVLASLDRDKEIDALRTSHAWELVHAGHAGVSRPTALVHRVAIVTGSADARPLAGAVPAGEPRYAADTGELLWDLATRDRGVVTIDTPRSKAVIGFGAGKRFDLGGVVIEPGPTHLNGWSTVTVTAVEGTVAGPGRLLVTATGLVENTDMKWKSPAHESVGRNWGKAPSLADGVPVRLTLPAAADRVKGWTLDERGQRRGEVPVHADGGHARIELGPVYKTLWYEIEVR